MSTLNVTNISDGTNTTATTNVVKGSAKAWVNFNGTGTVAIREGYNVSSITDNGTGDYTVNFETAFEDTNYSVSGSVSWNNASWGNVFCLDAANYLATSFGFHSVNSSSTSFVRNDALIACVQVFR